jgi:Arc/MetJ family transcription regulator
MREPQATVSLEPLSTDAADAGRNARGAGIAMQIHSSYHLHREARVRTTLNIDEVALASAMRTARGKTKTAVINEALREYARRRRIRRLLEFRGRARWDGKLDDLRGRERAAR